MSTPKADYRSSAKVFQVLGNESGLKIFMLLNHNRQMCVSDIAAASGLSLSAASHQLAKLESTGLISSRREGRNVCYAFNESKLNTVLCSSFGCAEDRWKVDGGRKKVKE